jgi:hypothetical protein
MRMVAICIPLRIIMFDKPSTDRKNLKEIKQLLARVQVIRAPCELDLLLFLYRHPRALLTNERLAALVGYEPKQVDKATDEFIVARLLQRTHNAKHTSRMYLLDLHGEYEEDLIAILRLASTRQGRVDILEVLNSGQSRTGPQARQERGVPDAND